MALRDEIKEQHKSIADKGFKYKLEYFIEYYKWATIAVIIAIIVIFSFVKQAVTAKSDAIYGICVNAITMPDEEIFGEYIGINPKKERVVFDTTYSMVPESANQNSYISLQKMVATMAASAADFILGDKDVLEDMANNQFYADLRDYFTQEELDALGDKVFYVTYTDEAGNEISDPTPVIIDVTQSAVMSSYPYFVGEVGFGIITNTTRPEKSRKFYDFLNDEELVERAKTELDDAFLAE